MTRHLCLVLGGARSGKSTWAENRLHQEPVRYVATGYGPAGDAEWAQRIETHRQRRPADWQTVETLDVASVLLVPDERPILIDCLTLWLTRIMDEAGAWHGSAADGSLIARIDGLLAALQATAGQVVCVSNEVGAGIVPDTASGRLFVDRLGELNRRVAAVCDEVVWMVAGIPMTIKGSAPPRRGGTA